jgi:(1->4)-alpha-D-glucan 1-alpha-D-glucosylmutase
VGSLPAEHLQGEPEEAALAAFAHRIEAAMLKSARESKAITGWTNPNAAYETALKGFVQALLRGPREHNLFLADLQANAAVLAWFGALNGLTLALVKALSPGVPDFYQGHELIELSLVDPDNRRPVDYARRQALLAEAQALWTAPGRSDTLRAWVAQAVDGRAKFWVTWRALQLRQAHDPMLRQSAYLPLEVRGRFAPHVLAFARWHGPSWVVVIAPRLWASMGHPAGAAPLDNDWDDTAVVFPETVSTLPGAGAPWLEDAIGGGRHGLVDGALPLATVLTACPVAVLAGTLADTLADAPAHS